MKTLTNTRQWQALSLIVTLSIGLFVPALASASSQRFFAINSKPQQGIIVSLTSNSGVVEPASQQNAKSLVGIVAPADDIPSDQQPGQINVRTAGVANAFVSTLNGDIKAGDRIGVSSLTGVGSKLKTSGWTVGTAQGNISANSKAVKATVTDSTGAKHVVYVASIPVLVKAMYYTVPNQGKDSLLLPASLQSTADNIAGKHASTLALLLSFALLLSGIISASMVVSSAIRGGLMAIARQPLTKSIITRKVFQAMAMAMVILVAVIAGTLLLLRIL